MSEREYLDALHKAQADSVRGLMTREDYEERVMLLTWKYLALRPL